MEAWHKSRQYLSIEPILNSKWRSACCVTVIWAKPYLQRSDILRPPWIVCHKPRWPSGLGWLPLRQWCYFYHKTQASPASLQYLLCLNQTDCNVWIRLKAATEWGLAGAPTKVMLPSWRSNRMYALISCSAETASSMKSKLNACLLIWSVFPEMTTSSAPRRSAYVSLSKRVST